jgi:hypothetical protein
VQNNGGLTVTTLSVVQYNTSGSNGGGVVNRGGRLTVNHSVLNANTALSGDGGGLFNFNGGTASVANGSTVENNSANTGAGIDNLATLGVSNNVLLENNRAKWNGGGLANWSYASVYGSCMFWGNTAGNNGGGIYNAATLSVMNTNFEFDHAANVGGGVCNWFGSLSDNLTRSNFAWCSAGFAPDIFRNPFNWF